MFFPLQWQLRMYAEATILSIAGLDLPPKHGNPFAHAYEPVSRQAVDPAGGRHPAAVVRDVHLDVVLAVAKRHLCSRGTGVLQRVAQRLLDDPERGQVDT